ncbi:MAG: hypothetical protein PHD32_04130 [Eubacteriales bacterium]|nr:hypothetical protein [Eubacteriales bacterium]
MDLYVHNFDAQFEKYLNKWMRDNRDLYHTMEEMEAAVEDIYAMWLELPAKWLDDEKPSAYFAKYDDAALLVKWLEKYINADVPVPDQLLDAIVALGERAEAPLLRLKNRESDIIRSPEKLEDANALCITLLNQIGSTQPMQDYIDAIIANPGGEHSESMAEALGGMGEGVVEPILARIEEAKEELALSWLLSVLAEYPGDKRISAALADAYSRAEDNRALFAALIGKYGDETLIPLLKESLKKWELNYLDWIEARNAVEELGGTVAIAQPDFDGDPYYESMRNM